MANFTLIEAEGLGQIVRKSQVILSSQVWVAPLRLAGNTVYVTGCAGGGSGNCTGAYASSSVNIGGSGGNYVEKLPLIVTPGSSYTITIPAGGLGSTSTGNAGGDLTFGSLLTIKGGSGGTTIGNGVSSLQSLLNSIKGVLPPYFLFASSNTLLFSPGQCINGNTPGDTTSPVPSGGTAGGGAAGYFGVGANGRAQDAIITGNNAGANTGAGGGAVIGQAGSTSGAGGSGRLIIEWDELV
jgi:hypothetical protein